MLEKHGSRVVCKDQQPTSLICVWKKIAQALGIFKVSTPVKFEIFVQLFIGMTLGMGITPQDAVPWTFHINKIEKCPR